MKILIIGSGSIGVYLGVLLHKNGHEVKLFGREKLKKIHKTILIEDEVFTTPTKIYSFPLEKKYDFIFITSKLYDLENNLKEIKENNLISKNIVSIQNGLVDNSIYNKYVDNNTFALISIFEGFRLIENQLKVSKSDIGWKIDDSIVGKKVSDLLQKIGINCTTEKYIDSIRAEKLIINSSVNILSAIEEKTLFELYNENDTKNIIDNLFDESYKVLSKEFKIKEKGLLRMEFYNLIKDMRHYSSTYQDAIAHKKTEINFLNNLIIKLAEKNNIKVPTNKKIVSEFYKKYKKF